MCILLSFCLTVLQRSVFYVYLLPLQTITHHYYRHTARLQAARANRAVPHVPKHGRAHTGTGTLAYVINVYVCVVYVPHLPQHGRAHPGTGTSAYVIVVFVFVFLFFMWCGCKCVVVIMCLWICCCVCVVVLYEVVFMLLLICYCWSFVGYVAFCGGNITIYESVYILLLLPCYIV